MGYDRGDSFPFDFEPDGISFGSKSKGKLSPRSYPIQFERKLNTSFLGVGEGISKIETCPFFGVPKQKHVILRRAREKLQKEVPPPHKAAYQPQLFQPFQHSENQTLLLFQNIIVLTIFHLIMSKMELRLVHIQQEKCQHEHISFNLAEN